MVEMQTVTPVSGFWAKPGEMGGLAQVHCNTCTPYRQQRRPRQVRAKREWRWGEVVCSGGPVARQEEERASSDTIGRESDGRLQGEELRAEELGSG